MPPSTKSVPFVGLEAQSKRLRPEIEAALLRVLDHGRFVNGPEIEQLEEALGDATGAPFVVGLSNGTDAIVVALLALGIGPGDAVFVPSFTFTATAEAVLLLGATPVFVEVGEDSFNIDPASVEAQIVAVRRRGELRPRAVLAVDLFGLPADYHRLRYLCDDAGVELIADAAQSVGGSQDGIPVGALAPVSTTSFFPAKPLGAYGDAGALFTLHHDIAERARSIREHGQGAERYAIERVGLNARLDSFQAAVLLVKLRVLAEEIERREELARLYDAELGDAVRLPPRMDGSQSAWAQYTVRVDARGRDRVREELAQRGVPTAVYYPLPMHLQPAYRDCGDGVGSLPVSERLCGEVMSLPMDPYMEADTGRWVCEQVREVVAAVENVA